MDSKAIYRQTWLLKVARDCVVQYFGACNDVASDAMSRAGFKPIGPSHIIPDYDDEWQL